MASLTASAQEIPDESRSGAITVKMKYEGKAVKGGILKAYRVGRIIEDDGDYSFVKTKAMEDFKGSYKDISDPKLAEKVAAYVTKKKLSAYASVKNEDGKAVFSDLELGLYLIVQTKASEGYKPLQPFLVSVPMYEDGRYLYKVNAEGKFQLDKDPGSGTPSTSGETERPGEEPRPGTPSGSGGTEKPLNPSGTGTSTKPPQLTLPQTGQLNWPIPVLVVLGLVLFTAGWQLRFGNKRDGYER